MAKRGRKSAKRATAPGRTAAVAKAIALKPKASKGAVIGLKVGKLKSSKLKSSRPKKSISANPGSKNPKSGMARLQNELRIARDRQTATAAILKVIASSPSDVQPVFDAIAESSKRLSGGHTALVTRVVGDMVHLAAFTAGSDTGTREIQSSFPAPLSSSGILHSRVARSGEIAFRTDIETEPDITPGIRELARARGYRAILVVPMLLEGIAIGTIGITRRDPGPFAGNVIDLLRTFADQAVIAIENTRLFNETQEALERQTATAEILKVIASSPSDTTPVFNAIAGSTKRLLSGFSVAVFRLVDGMVHVAAFTPVNPAADAALEADFPQPVEEFEAFKLAEHGQP